MGGLWPLVPLEADESPTSFVSRLARLHVKTARRFCQDLGIGFQSLVNGGREALGRLSYLARAPLGTLIDNAMVRTGRNDHLWRGQAIGSENLSRFTLQVCPRCLEEDVALSARGLGHGPYGRATWLVRYLRTCPRHLVALIPVRCALQTLHDFVPSVEPVLGRLRDGGLPIEERLPSRLEHYLLQRLEGRPPAETAWLNGLGFSAAADTCEVMGAVIAFGRGVSMRRLDGRARHIAGDVGFLAASEGPAGIREVLAAWDLGSSDDGSRSDGPLATYGHFRSFLMRHQERRPELEPVRALVSDHIRWTTPVGPGDLVLGRPVGERLIHSLQTASEEYGLDVRFVRRVLKATRAIDAQSDGYRTESVLFDARASRKALEDAAASIPGERVRLHLNVSNKQAGAIMRSGLIPAFMDGADTLDIWSHRYAASDLDHFLARLNADALPVNHRPSGFLPIPVAARHAGCDPIEVVRLVLERRLPRVARLAAVPGFKAILVRTADVRSVLKPDASPVLTTVTLAQRLRLAHKTVCALLETGVIPSRELRTAADGKKHRVVEEGAAREFSERYVYLSSLMRVWGLPQRTCRDRLKALGLKPALPRSTYGVDLYLRSDLT